ncbi:MAG: hypothetical protein EOO05_03505 [Chitinophagaceae bacterium]|nr:MAG: hypothetical protein EOO05_03505 [Chitinophagaceae bacterium]
MKKLILAISLAFTGTSMQAQKTEIKLDGSFKPTDSDPVYLQYAEKKGDLYSQEIVTWPNKKIYVRLTSKDLNGDIPEGEYIVYYDNGRAQSKAEYKDGKLHGSYRRFYVNGKPQEISNYSMGKKSGVARRFYQNGLASDSMIGDGKGGTREWHFYETGVLMMEGESMNDTSKVKTWKYFNEQGELMGSELYNPGNSNPSQSFNAAGQAIAPETCKTMEAFYPGGEMAFHRFISQNLNPDIPVKKGAPAGLYRVLVQFVIAKDGSVADIKAATSYGFGMEQEAIRVVRRSPQWVPGTIFGQPFVAHRIQPISFLVEELPAKKR